MSVNVRPRRGRKLLVASAGVAAISFAGVGCSGTSVANLPAPPSCDVSPSQPWCQTDAGHDGGDAAALTPDGSTDARDGGNGG